MCGKGQYRPRAINVVEKEDCSEDNFELDTTEVGNTFIDDVKSNNVNQWFENITINNTLVAFKVDTGAQCNIISINELKKLKLDKLPLKKANTVIKSFTNNIVPVLGQCKLECNYNGEKFDIPFFVIESNKPNLSGLSACIELGLVSCVNSIDGMISEEYKCLFDGEIGKIPVLVNIEVDRNVKPVISPARKLPFSLYQQVKMN